MTTVIKPGAEFRAISAATPLHLSEHVAEAHALVERARREAQRITTEAKEIARRYFEESKRQGYAAAYKEGFERGEAAGQKQAFDESTARFEQAHASLAQAMTAATGEVETAKTDLQIAAQRDLLGFAVRVASAMTREIGRTDSKTVEENLRRAIRLVGADTDVTIRVNPKDAETMRVFAPKLFKQLRDGEHVDVVADEAIAPGGCTLAAGETEVDATLDTQIEIMVKTLLGGGRGDD